MNDERQTHLDPLAVVLLLGCCMTWGLGQVAAKAGLAGYPPMLQGGARSLGAAALLLLWSRYRRVPLFARDGTARGGLLAGTLFAAEFACIFAGLQFTSASRMAVFIYLAPFVVALGMPLVSHRERLAQPQVLGLLVAFSGVVWAFAEGFSAPRAGEQQWLGDSLGLLAALLWGLTTLTLRGSRVSAAAPEKTLLYQLGVSGVSLTAAGLLRGETWPAQGSGWPLAALLFQITVVSFASYLVWFWLMRHYAATRISAFTLLTPMFGLLAGVLLLHEPLTQRLVIALVAVSAGLWLVNRPARRP
jgi:drug/metabolite transporter (DMT)-like permease